METSTKWLIVGLVALVAFGGGTAYYADEKNKCEFNGGTWQGLFGPCQSAPSAGGTSTGTGVSTGTGTTLTPAQQCAAAGGQYIGGQCLTGTALQQYLCQQQGGHYVNGQCLQIVNLAIISQMSPSQFPDGMWTFSGVGRILNQVDVECCATSPGGCNCVNTRNDDYFCAKYQNSCTDARINQMYPGFLSQYHGLNNNGYSQWEVGMGGRTTALGKYYLSCSSNQISVAYIPGHGYYSGAGPIPSDLAQALISQNF